MIRLGLNTLELLLCPIPLVFVMSTPQDKIIGYVSTYTCFKTGKPGQGQVWCGHFLRNREVSFAADVLFIFIVSKHLVIY